MLSSEPPGLYGRALWDWDTDGDSDDFWDTTTIIIAVFLALVLGGPVVFVAMVTVGMWIDDWMQKQQSFPTKNENLKENLLSYGTIDTLKDGVKNVIVLK